MGAPMLPKPMKPTRFDALMLTYSWRLISLPSRDHGAFARAAEACHSYRQALRFAGGGWVPDTGWLWALFTVIAAAAQTVRNATQRELTAKLGTVGATHVRFLFGFPFALVFLAAVMIALGQETPRPPLMFWPWVMVGALAQVAATALMLAAMNDRSFVVVYAYIKTEPVQVA